MKPLYCIPLIFCSLPSIAQSHLSIGGGIGLISSGYNLTETSIFYDLQQSYLKPSVSTHIDLEYSYALTKKYNVDFGFSFSDRSVNYDSLYYRSSIGNVTYYKSEKINFADLSLGISRKFYKTLSRCLTVGIKGTVLIPVVSIGEEVTNSQTKETESLFFYKDQVFAGINVSTRYLFLPRRNSKLKLYIQATAGLYLSTERRYSVSENSPFFTFQITAGLQIPFGN